VKTVTVLIAEGNTAYGQSLSQMFQEEGGIQVLAAVGSGRAAVEAVERLRPNVILMDIDMPDREGLWATQVIRERWPSVRIVILTLHSSQAFRTWAKRIGAAAFLPKDTDPEEIVRAIRGICRKEHESP